MHPVYRLFYREKGTRYPDQLFNIREFKLSSFPRESIFHVYDDGDGKPELDTSKSYYKDYSKKIVVEHVFQYYQPEGQFRQIPFNPSIALQPWRRANSRNWLLADDIVSARLTGDQLGVVNYGFMDSGNRWQPVPMTPFYRWKNRVKTMYYHMNRLATSTKLNQFIIVNIPRQIQGKTILDKFVDREENLVALNVFGSYDIEGFIQLDFWRWLSLTHRKRSLLNLINPANYDKINFVFKGVNGKEVLVNLAYLDAWIKGQPNQTFETSIIQMSELNVQKLFLKLCLSLNEINDDTEDPSSVIVSDPDKKPVIELEENKENLQNPILDVNVEDENEGEGDLSGLSVKKPVVNQGFKSADQIESEISRVSKKASNDSTSELMDSIEKDLEALDKVSLTQLKNKGISKLDGSGEDVKESVVNSSIPEAPSVNREEVRQKVFKSLSSEEVLYQKLSEDAEANIVTAAEFRRMVEAVKKHDESKDPYGSGKLRKEARVILKEDIVIDESKATIPTSDAVVDKTMGESTVNVFNRQYLKNVLRKDILNAVDKVQAAGVIIKAHEINQTTTALGTYEHHRLELKPIDGAPSVVKFSLPVVNDDGTFLAASNKYLLRKQRTDIPIRKIAPSIVALSTYYGKTFVQVSPKVVNNSTAWVIRQINLSIVTEDAYIKNISPGNVFDNEFKAPFIYNAIASEFEKFNAGGNTFFFNHRHRQELVSQDLLEQIEKNGRVLCGLTHNKRPIVVDTKNNFFSIANGEETSLGDIYSLLKLKREDAPTDYAEVRIFSKYVPIGIVLAYYIGFKSVLALSGATYRTVEPRKNKQLQPNEYAIVFKDITYVLNRDERLATLIMAGFLDYEKSIKNYDSSLFDHKDVYLNLFMTKKLSALYVRELDIMEHSYVDHISEEILQSMNEPTTFKGLLVRSAELLLTYHHPVSQDRSVMRDRGYERFAGTVYKELIQAVRQFRNKNMVGRSKVDMSPYQVWNAIMKDSAIKIVEDINPIQNLKEAEVITYSGTGGRDKETMTKPTRAYHASDVGILSESTVDNAGVGTVAYLSANPNIADVRGMAKPERKLNPTSIMSTASLVSPFSFTDNPKRIMFINTQHSHTIASSAYRQPYIRTGYEKVIAKRTGKMFSCAAKEDGVVVSKNDKGMVVKYSSGETEAIELGRLYGKAEGTVYPHDLHSAFKEGDKFKAGDVLAYNTKFYEPDFLDSKEVNLKISGAAVVAFIEDKTTHEDSATISPRLGSDFKTEVTKIKSYVVRFTQNIRDIKRPGEQVNPKDVLMIIEDDITSTAGQFSDESLDALRRLSNAAPRANISGVVEKIEVFYHGDKRDMSNSIHKLAEKSDKDMADRAKSTGAIAVNGRVTDEYRVEGTPLELDHAEIRIYITTTANSGVGDKVIFGHQMKSTIAEVHSGEIHTENGLEVDAIFSYRSLAAREVNSTTLMGTTTLLLDKAGERAIKLFEEGK